MRLARVAVEQMVRRVAQRGIPRRTPTVLRVLPHDTEAFTQGLACCDGLLYESTGSSGRSSLRCLDASTGQILRRLPVAEVWAEGIAIRHGALVQLTWRDGRAFVYSVPDLVRQGELRYRGEGWGLTAAPSSFIMSNGSSRLSFRDSGLGVARSVRVSMNGLPARLINDIAYARGKVYANLWYSDCVYEIDLPSGRITGVVDCAELVGWAQPASPHSVLNGIAYNAESDTFFVTGKNWRFVFEVRM